MSTVWFFFRLFLLTTILNATVMASAAAQAPVSQAWAVRIDGPTNEALQVGGMAVGPSGDVFLAGPFRSGGYYLRDILITRRSASSGAPVWERRYEPPEGPSASEYASGIIARGANVYVIGGITTTNGRTDFLTLKYSDTGGLEWVSRWPSPGSYGYGPTDLAVDGQGNVVVLGLDMVVLKYGPTGNLLWTYSYDDGDGLDRAAEMRVDAGGNVYVVGTSGGASEESFAFTLKLDPDGHELWRAAETSVNLAGGTANGLDVDSTGNVVTVARDQVYGILWKYDTNGTRQWMTRHRAEGPASVYAMDVRFDGSGNIIVAAHSGGDGLLIKYAADGQQLWTSRISVPYNPAYATALDLDSTGNSYLILWPYSDGVTAKVNPDGVQLWTVTYNIDAGVEDKGDYIEVTPSGDVFVAGHTYYSNQSYASLVKYAQQQVADVATAVVTPALQVVDPGTNVVFTAETTGPGPIQFQWRKNGQPIPDATNSTLSLSNVQAADRADYSVIISNLAGVTVSPEARLSVRVPPEVVISPAEALAYLGTDTAFAATVSGNDFATLQWRHNGANIPGATNKILRMTNLNADASGSYDIVVSTFGGSTTSSAAGLRISSAVELVGTTPYPGHVWGWDEVPLLRVLPNGEFLIAARSNHVMGSSIVLHKYGAEGGLLWTAAFESPEFTNAHPLHLVLDGAGNIYIAGVSRQPNLAGALGVLKYNPDGQLLWFRLTGTGSIHAFAVDPQGNSVIGVLVGRAASVTRLNHAGDLQWSFVNPSLEDDFMALAVDASGNTFLGTTIIVEGYNHIRLRKFDSTGAIVWTGPDTQGPHSRLGTIAVDAAGHLIVAGTGEPPAGFAGVMFVQKYSLGGQKLWETRTGTSWGEIVGIYTIAVGPGDEITILTMSDDDYEPGEESGLTRIEPDGRLKYRIKEKQLFVWRPSHLALDNFGNAYMTGWGGRDATGLDATTAKYDAYGNRHWLVYHNGPQFSWQWQYSFAVGADAAGDIRVLATDGNDTDSGSDFSVIHYRQQDPASTFRLQLIPDPGGTFHLSTPAQEPFRIEASADLQSWDLLTEAETQQLLQPGANSFADSPKRFFRLIFTE
jgi:hypothetical protein